MFRYRSASLDVRELRKHGDFELVFIPVDCWKSKLTARGYHISHLNEHKRFEIKGSTLFSLLKVIELQDNILGQLVGERGLTLEGLELLSEDLENKSQIPCPKCGKMEFQI